MNDKISDFSIRLSTSFPSVCYHNGITGFMGGISQVCTLLYHIAYCFVHDFVVLELLVIENQIVFGIPGFITEGYLVLEYLSGLHETLDYSSRFNIICQLALAGLYCPKEEIEGCIGISCHIRL